MKSNIDNYVNNNELEQSHNKVMYILTSHKQERGRVNTCWSNCNSNVICSNLVVELHLSQFNFPIHRRMCCFTQIENGDPTELLKLVQRMVLIIFTGFP